MGRYTSTLSRIFGEPVYTRPQETSTTEKTPLALRVAYNPNTNTFFASPRNGIVFTGASIDELARTIGRNQTWSDVPLRAKPGEVYVRKRRGRNFGPIKRAAPATQYAEEIIGLPSLIAAYAAQRREAAAAEWASRSPPTRSSYSSWSQYSSLY